MKKVSVKIFDSVPIDTYIYSLLHAEIGVENKIIYTYFNWIIEKLNL